MADFGGNFKELCRLCASFDAIKMDIFGERGKERKLLDKIHTCLPLKVSEEDLLPKSLCYRCIYNLENFYDFRKGCVDAVSRLESYVNETWGNALELQYKPQKKVKEEQEVEINSVLSVRSEYSDSQEAPNPADFLEACMDNVPIHSSSPQYEQSARYEQEQVIEVNAGSFVCPSCPQSFNNMSALILHSKCHLGGGTLTMTGKKEAVRLFTCPVCDKTFVSKGNLSNHIKVHSSEGYTPVQDSTMNILAVAGLGLMYLCTVASDLPSPVRYATISTTPCWKLSRQEHDSWHFKRKKWGPGEQSITDGKYHGKQVTIFNSNIYATGYKNQRIGIVCECTLYGAEYAYYKITSEGDGVKYKKQTATIGWLPVDDTRVKRWWMRGIGENRSFQAFITFSGYVQDNNLFKSNSSVKCVNTNHWPKKQCDSFKSVPVAV